MQINVIWEINKKNRKHLWYEVWKTFEKTALLIIRPVNATSEKKTNNNNKYNSKNSNRTEQTNENQKLYPFAYNSIIVEENTVYRRNNLTKWENQQNQRYYWNWQCFKMQIMCPIFNGHPKHCPDTEFIYWWLCTKGSQTKENEQEQQLIT